MRYRTSLHELQRHDEILALADAVGASALQAWFDNQPDTPGAAPGTKVVGDGAYKAKIERITTRYTDNVHLVLTHADDPRTKIMIHGRQVRTNPFGSQSVQPPSDKRKAFDWTEYRDNLRWRQKQRTLTNRFDLVPTGVRVGETQEPPIMSVMAPNLTTVIQAEELLLRAAQLLIGPASQATPETE